MAYTINRYNRAILTVVEDGTLDETTDLKFVGKNYANYGEIQNENFLFLLENFAGGNQPPKAISGQIWFDSSQSKLKFYDGTKFRTTGGAEVGASAPSGLTEGDFWWDTANEQLYAYNGTEFVLVGPQDAGEGVTQMQSRTVRDTVGNSRSIIASIVDDEVIHIISNIEFTIGTEDAGDYPGFDRIKKGLTLKNTQLATGGVSGQDFVFQGSASNALKLGGFDASSYVRSGSANFTTLVSFGDDGFALGDSNDLRVYIPTGTDNKVAISNEIGDTIFLNAKEAGGIKNSLRITPTAILPGVEDITANPLSYVLQSVDIGSSTAGFDTIYATTFDGEATNAVNLKVGSNYRGASMSTSANTVAVRDAAGDLSANIFRGTALTAKFADLAEIYKTDQDYEVGTVVAVGGAEEVTAADSKDLAVGVISEAPAYLMNQDADGQAIALKGRVPVRVKGSVNKGDAVYAWSNGVASTVGTQGIVGIALETNDSEEEKLVECVLKV